MILVWEIKKNDESGAIEAKSKENLEDKKKIENLRKQFKNEAKGRLKYKDMVIAKLTNVFYEIRERNLGISSLDSFQYDSQPKHRNLSGVIGNLRFLKSSFAKVGDDPRWVLRMLDGDNTIELDSEKEVEKYKNVTLEFPSETDPYTNVDLKFIKFFWSDQRPE